MDYKVFTRKSIFSKLLLLCGVVSSLLYIITDVYAGNIYFGYSFNEQAVSELFAIGAPTASIVVFLFTLSSILLLFMGYGIFIISNNKLLQFASIMVIFNALNCIVLWNFFPMHMRGVQPDFSDQMHTILAINPFILITIIMGSIIFNNWFRIYSLLTIVLLFIPAFLSIANIPLFLANQPTPWMGYYERISQYSHMIWHIIFAIKLIRNNVNIKHT